MRKDRLLCGKGIKVMLPTEAKPSQSASNSPSTTGVPRAGARALEYSVTCQSSLTKLGDVFLIEDRARSPREHAF
jgi:hypothetical protein